DGGHDHTRRAEAALQAMIVLERLLHRVQLAVRGEAFDRSDLRAIAARREHRARLDCAAVDVDDAGPALRGVASDMRAGQAQILPQELHEQRPRIDIRRRRAAVHRHRDMNHPVILPNQDFLGAASAAASLLLLEGVAEAASPTCATPSVAAAAKLAKNLSAMFLATPSI